MATDPLETYLSGVPPAAAPMVAELDAAIRGSRA